MAVALTLDPPHPFYNPSQATSGFAGNVPLPGVFPQLDLDAICAPYAPMLQDIFKGKRFRLDISYGQARFLFFHGCLMGRVYYQGRCWSFPPFDRNAQGVLTWRLSSLGDKFSQHEFFTLPHDILLFFFNLLKLTFQQELLLCPTQHPAAAYVLSEVGWQKL
ncbi:MAG: hypothetical protein VKJ04_05630 [Vampirovibrionales bacterium]|nr:hypothetical protein [Vampirovibrionales bacterium]